MKFSIRDLLWLTTLVAVCVAWSIDHYSPSPIRYTEAFGSASPWLEGKTVHDVFATPAGDVVIRFTDGSCCRICDVGLSGPGAMIENDVGTCLIHAHRTFR